MKTILLTTLSCILSFFVFAQRSGAGSFEVKGRLIDSSSNQPIEYGSVSMFLKGKKEPTNGAVSDGEGNFISS